MINPLLEKAHFSCEEFFGAISKALRRTLSKDTQMLLHQEALQVGITKTMFTMDRNLRGDQKDWYKRVPKKKHPVTPPLATPISIRGNQIPLARQRYAAGNL